MGQKVNPNGFRYGITKKYESNWYSNKYDFANYLLEDQKIRTYVEKFVRQYQIGKIEINRTQNQDVTLIIHSAKPGVILGDKASNIDKLIIDIQKHTKNRDLKLNIKIVTIEKPELNAKLAAEMIAVKLENRESFRIAQKQAMRSAFYGGAIGVKTQVSGRLNGADMARTEGYQEGIMALHTLRQNVSYAKATARTTYGAIGIKVWISLDGNMKGKK